jgi:hypothetical protein
MQALSIKLNLEETPFDLPADAVVVGNDSVREGVQIGVLPNATVSGNPSVAICIPTGENEVRYVIVEMTLALFQAAAASFEVRYGKVEGVGL